MTKEEPKEKVETKAEEEKTEPVQEKVVNDDEKVIEVEEKDAEVVEVKEKDDKRKPNRYEKKFDMGGWNPKTEVGKQVKNGEITDIEDLFNNGYNILESEIVDVLVKDIQTDLLLIGQSKGKFGGGQRRVFRQTQKKTKEGNKPKFATYALAGNKNGIVGVGYGKAKETVPAREKALRNAKLNVFKIRRGCGSWECNCKDHHSIPFSVEGKCGSVIIKLIPAPKGTGLCVEKECAKILGVAGIKDVWSKTIGQTKTKINTIKACEKALKKLIATKTFIEHNEKLNIVEGKSPVKEKEVDE